MKKIGISFKDNEEEMFKFLKKQLSPSIYIKQLLLEQMKEEIEVKEEDIDTEYNF